jgi:hypothetical protein
MLRPIVEGEPIHVVDEGLGRRVLRQDEGVVPELHVIVRGSRGKVPGAAMATLVASAPAETVHEERVIDPAPLTQQPAGGRSERRTPEANRP